ncbi:MAG: UDP-N-acetylmuramate--L-alanine ligase [Bacteroides sp.]|nr:UDP-N-acetylmuramate--L-alanine ligase [Bacteroidales bacterium]MBD5424992.1 UDP-N-acetylmuramate--L-alanine ligase [Bacteroides sp.]
MSKNNIYFVGAGGIGMAALERYFLSRGCKVAGYDRTPSELTAALEAEGVEIAYSDDPDLIPAAFRNPDETLVVYTPAIPADHRGLQWFRANGFEVVKRAAVLGRVTRSEKAICFAGTHGKTTTSSMAAHILEVSGVGSNAFLGGVLRNYGTNFLLSETSPYAVIEADEYDRSFHQLSPYVAVITSTDPDHLDIYGTEEAYLESFAHFTELIQPGGALLLHTGLKLKPRQSDSVRVYTYGVDSGDFHAENLTFADGTITFDLVTPTNGTITGIELGVPLEINVDNAIAACAGVMLVNDPAITADDYRTAMKTFLGAKRRFEFWLREPERSIIDDYAHHPDELRASIRSVRRLFPGKRLVVAFQPHLFSRTRDFAADFAEALSQADSVYLLPIYPARELPIPGVTSEIILDRITCPEKQIVEKEQLVDALAAADFDVLLTVGAGDINLLLPRIVDACK